MSFEDCIKRRFITLSSISPHYSKAYAPYTYWHYRPKYPLCDETVSRRKGTVLRRQQDKIRRKREKILSKINEERSKILVTSTIGTLSRKPVPFRFILQKWEEGKTRKEKSQIITAIYYTHVVISLQVESLKQKQHKNDLFNRWVENPISMLHPIWSTMTSRCIPSIRNHCLHWLRCLLVFFQFIQ